MAKYNVRNATANYTNKELSDELGFDENMLPLSDKHIGQYFVRFMSENEYIALMRGDVMRNNTRHGRTCRSSSEGFCFLPIERTHIDDEMCENVAEAYQMICGTCSRERAVVFRNEGAPMTVGYGVYADPYGDYYDVIDVEEYSTVEYTRDTLVPVWTCWDIDELNLTKSYLSWLNHPIEENAHMFDFYESRRKKDPKRWTDSRILEGLWHRYESRNRSIEQLTGMREYLKVRSHKWI